MKDSEILKKAIEKAIENGFNNGLSSSYDNVDKLAMIWNIACNNPNTIIFNHHFAKAFFGKKLLCYDCGEPVMPPETILGGTVILGTGSCSCSRQFENNDEAWEYHLKQMVLEENPISYLKKFI